MVTIWSRSLFQASWLSIKASRTNYSFEPQTSSFPVAVRSLGRGARPRDGNHRTAIRCGFRGATREPPVGLIGVDNALAWRHAENAGFERVISVLVAKLGGFLGRKGRWPPRNHRARPATPRGHHAHFRDRAPSHAGRPVNIASSMSNGQRGGRDHPAARWPRIALRNLLRW